MASNWKTRLELNVGNHKVQGRWIRIRFDFLQGDSEIPVAIFLEETTGYRMGPPRENLRRGRTACFFDDLKSYQESHNQLEAVGEIIVKASEDTYGAKKCAEIVFRRGKMTEHFGREDRGAVLSKGRLL